MNYRVMAKQNRYDIIDFAKGFSIITIVFMHFIQHFMEHAPHVISLAATVGGSGVHVFIFCSGFGLYLSYLKNPTNYWHFLKSRFKKIYVPYVIVILISAMIPYMYHDKDKIIALLSHVLLFKMFIPRYQESFGGQFWFISTIIQFYLVFIPLCKIKNCMKKSQLFFLLSLMISIFYWIYIVCIHKETSRVWNSFFLQYIWEFCLGMCCAERLNEGKSISVNKVWLWFISVIAISVMALMGILGGMAKIFNDIPALIGYGGICIGIYFLKVGIINRVILGISLISYELFLVHMLVGKTISIMVGKAMNNFAYETVMVVGMFMFSVLVAYMGHFIMNFRKARIKS